MCGISGFFLSNISKGSDFFRQEILKMNNELLHRGPNNGDVWFDLIDKIFLGHRRLSIIDLSDKGNQPMKSNNQRFVISFNGEIYNYKELKKDLIKNKIKFDNKSDTQVLLEVLSFYGIEDGIKKVNGMFAFALWDKKEKSLYLVSDRLGKKPLYWSNINNNIIFGSELKSLVSFYMFKREINKKSLQNFLKFSYINSPDTIFKNTYKLEPASILRFNSNKNVTKSNYWKLDFNYGNQFNNHKNDEEKIEKLSNLLEDSISKRMISDVPLGVMLSGGIDSSLVAAIAQKNSTKKVNTYSIGFKNKGFDESKYASKVSKILSTSHNEFILDDYSVEDLVEKIPLYYDEPFADSSQIPSMLISSQLKKKVTVALTGDGGDEVFGGYSRYIWGNKFSKICKLIPFLFRNIISKSLQLIPSEKINNINELIPVSILPPQLGDRVKKIGRILSSKSNYEIYLKLITQMDEKILLNQAHTKNNLDESIFLKNNISKAMQIMDLKNYLPGDILTKIDRASMASSLELRSPLLDYRLIEFSFNNLNPNDVIYKNKGKYILRKILKKYIPKNLINRPKMGFAIPLSKWLRGRLKNWMIDTLDSKKIKNQNIIDYKIINKMITHHIESKRNCHYELWNILMFQTWYDKWMK